MDGLGSSVVKEYVVGRGCVCVGGGGGGGRERERERERERQREREKARIGYMSVVLGCFHRALLMQRCSADTRLV